MAALAPLPYSRIADASTRRVADDTRRGMAAAVIEAQRVYGTPTPVQHGPTYLARYGEMVVCAPPVAGMAVVLPRIGPDDVGRTVTVVVTTDAGAVTLRASATTGGDVATINGAASITIAGAYACRQVVAITRDAWAVLVIRDGETSVMAPRWRYLSTTPPTGAPAPVEVWQFDGGAGQLTGRVASIALALSAGSPAQQMYMEHVGMVLLSSAQYATVTAAALQLVGDITIEACIAEKLPQGSSLSILACGDPNVALGVGTSQCCYAMRYSGSGYEELRYYHASAGLTTPQTYATGTTVPSYVAFTRSGGTVAAYLNGRQCASAAVAARPVAGGVSTSQFRLQRAQGDTTSSNETTWFSVRVSAGAYSAAQIAAAWAQVYS